MPTDNLKVEQLKSSLVQVLDRPTLKARNLASIIGKLISMSLVVGPVARLMTRSLYAVLITRQYWCQSLPVSHEARQIQFWLDNLDNVNGQGLWLDPHYVCHVSSSGYGGFTVEHGCHVAHGLFSKIEVAQSSTWRELHAVKMVLGSLVHTLHN